jgi:hypothetical protein
MRYVYYIDNEKYTTENYDEVPIYEISSPDENTPVFENLITGQKLWCLKGFIWHRLTGPALIECNGFEEFYLNDKKYYYVREWINNHPNPDLYFDAIGLNETDKILWYLKN